MIKKIFSYLKSLNKTNNLLQEKKNLETRERSQLWLDSLTPNEFSQLKKEIFKLVATTYYQKKNNLPQLITSNGVLELSVYDFLMDEEDVQLLFELDDTHWRLIILEMMVGSHIINNELNIRTKPNLLKLKIALLNVVALRRSSLKIHDGKNF
jgi:hypothetical protein